MSDMVRAFHALKAAREITGEPDGFDFKLSVIGTGESWPILDYHPHPGGSITAGLSREEAIRLLSAMLLDIVEMPEYAQ
jgi:hypothetical protein